MDFSVWVLGLAVLAGLIWSIDALFFRPARRRSSTEAGAPVPDPALVDWARTLFPVLLVVFLLRAFVAEPFRIPSGSMMPTVNVGDFILVNKSSYGWRWPGLNTRMVGQATPQRGDVIVFRFPGYPCPSPSGGTVRSGDATCLDPTRPVPAENWIKRVIGVPGDRVTMEGDTLTVNGKPVGDRFVGPFTGNRSLFDNRLLLDNAGTRWTETIPRNDGTTVTHDLLRMTDIVKPTVLPNAHNPDVVPAGCYLVLGDNRYDSVDSRWWGCVPDQNLVGRAFVIWLSVPGSAAGGIDWGRMGRRIR